MTFNEIDKKAKKSKNSKGKVRRQKWLLHGVAYESRADYMQALSRHVWVTTADEYCWRCYAIGLDDFFFNESTNWKDHDPIEWVEHYAIKYDLERVDIDPWR